MGINKSGKQETYIRVKLYCFSSKHIFKGINKILAKPFTVNYS